ncbi:MAG: EAL domain-containing protein [Acidimicrobiales bacterium]
MRRARAELNERQRARLGPTELVGDVLIAIGAPLVLWSDVSSSQLAAWGVVATIWAVVWDRTNKLARGGDGAASLLCAIGWVSTVIWAVLPWIAWPALDDRGVVWVLVFIVIFGIAADTVFVTQTSAISVDEMVVVYAGSYLVAFALHGQWAAIVATVAAGITFVVGGAGLGTVTGELVAQRAESDARNLVDELTGIGNRRAATTAIHALIAGGASQIHCAFIDLDDFKQLNDNYGYAVGDEALRSVAELLVAELPRDWTVARFGGDEFVAVGSSKPHLGPITTAEVSLVSRPGLRLSQPVSVGITSIPSARATADNLFQEGAAALRQAKRLGKHQVVEMTDEFRAAEQSTMRLANRIESAILDREIVPWGQSIVELHNRRIVGVELLARWPQADGSMVMPDEFVPVVEDQGRGPALGILMVDHAIETLARPDVRGTSLYISVNLSARHLFDRRLPTQIADRLSARRVAPHRLVIEITESQYLPSSPIWRETADRLRGLGLGLAIDDFGTGYSSMEQLLSMPFSHLKVDRVITQSIDRPGATDLAAAMAAMARGSDMVSIVEGIETEDQRRIMQLAGHGYGQGFLFSQPTPLDDLIAEFVRAEKRFAAVDRREGAARSHSSAGPTAM